MKYQCLEHQIAGSQLFPTNMENRFSAFECSSQIINSLSVTDTFTSHAPPKIQQTRNKICLFSKPKKKKKVKSI